ncbi:GNAT family N-acetyltransferase [Insulibacter thermoxylanivorax]|uniref:GNAT family N-acetyltransferase n=1 Tax=Insulibacter thermoxylanivorax TaxID=2749268 RepID=A0A916QFH1_9BACL|nr:GNAT family N-acetyltransferase [Insulibacter thermoxylanivorax]GFR38103.1 GNAT family N-acetyltransferase [Insulibacter thermoxylanivorax]
MGGTSLKQTQIVHTEEELRACIAIRTKVFVEEQNVPLELEIDEYDRSPDACIHVYVIQDGKPAGTARLIPYDEDTAKIQRVAVLQEYRGQGIGGMLLTALEGQARAQGARRCILDAQLHAVPFYEKQGYVKLSDDTFYDAGILHVRMVKELNE